MQTVSDICLYMYWYCVILHVVVTVYTCIIINIAVTCSMRGSSTDQYSYTISGYNNINFIE